MRSHKKGSLCITFGILLLVSALMLTGYNRFVQLKADRFTAGIFEQFMEMEEKPEEISQYTENPNVQMPVATVNGYDFIGTLEIASLQLKLPVMSEWASSKLRVSPCRYTGSVYEDNLIICAHNYKKHFGKIKTLKSGDAVSFTDMNGNLFRFKVVDIETVNPRIPEKITDGNWDLSLFTCTASGSSRVVVRCVADNLLTCR